MRHVFFPDHLHWRFAFGVENSLAYWKSVVLHGELILLEKVDQHLRTFLADGMEVRREEAARFFKGNAFLPELLQNELDGFVRVAVDCPRQQILIPFAKRDGDPLLLRVIQQRVRAVVAASSDDLPENRQSLFVINDIEDVDSVRIDESVR